MEKRIFEFRKTDHFLLSQWKRKVDDKDLKRILPFIHPDKRLKSVVIVSPTFLAQKNLYTEEDNRALILIIKEFLLITLYWCIDPEYLFKTEKKVKFLTLK